MNIRAEFLNFSPQIESPRTFFVFVCSPSTHNTITCFLTKIKIVRRSLPKLDSHVIDYFLSMAEHMESKLDDQTYASVKRIFSKDILMLEEFEDRKNQNTNNLRIDSLPDT